MFWARFRYLGGPWESGKDLGYLGTGLQYDGTDGLTTESLVLSAPMGPWTSGLGFYPHRPVERGVEYPPLFDPGSVLDPYDLDVPQIFQPWRQERRAFGT